MNSVWHENLIEEIAYRRCIFFTGSGLTASASNNGGEHPPTWKQFIVDLKDYMINHGLNAEKQSIIEEYIDQKDYLFALEAMIEDSDSGGYSHYVQSNLRLNGYKPSEAHKGQLSKLIREL